MITWVQAVAMLSVATSLFLPTHLSAAAENDPVPSDSPAVRKAMWSSPAWEFPAALTDAQCAVCRQVSERLGTDAAAVAAASKSAKKPFQLVQHTRNVLARAVAFLEHEPTADPFVTTLGAMVHDVGYLKTPKMSEHTQLGGPYAAEILTTAGVDPSLVERVVPIVVNHHKPAALAAIPEGRVVFMADKNPSQAPTGEEFAATAAKFFAATPE